MGHKLRIMREPMRLRLPFRASRTTGRPGWRFRNRYGLVTLR